MEGRARGGKRREERREEDRGRGYDGRKEMGEERDKRGRGRMRGERIGMYTCMSTIIHTVKTEMGPPIGYDE